MKLKIAEKLKVRKIKKRPKIYSNSFFLLLPDKKNRDHSHSNFQPTIYNYLLSYISPKSQSKPTAFSLMRKSLNNNNLHRLRNLLSDTELRTKVGTGSD